MEVIYYIFALVLSLTLHEFAHAWVGYFLGDETAHREGRLSLNPFVHIDPFMTLALPLFLILVGSPIIFGAAKPVPFRPWALRYGKWGAAMVALAGPLTNLLIALVCGLWLRIFPIANSTFLLTVLFVNIGFFTFNMIPFPPLDGSRVLYAIAPYGLRQIMDRIERSGMTAILLFMFIGYRFIAPSVGAVAIALARWLVPGASL